MHDYIIIDEYMLCGKCDIQNNLLNLHVSFPLGL